MMRSIVLVKLEGEWVGVDIVIQNRRTIHDYSDQQVDRNLLMRAIELAIKAPNHKLTFPWKFIVVGNKARMDLAQQAVSIKSTSAEMNEVKRAAIVGKFMTPSYLVALAVKRSEDKLKAREDYASMACAVQNMSLYLWENNVGCKWSSGAITCDNKTYEILQVIEEEYELVGFLWVGMARKVPVEPKRPPVTEFIQYID